MVAVESSSPLSRVNIPDPPPVATLLPVSHQKLSFNSNWITVYPIIVKSIAPASLNGVVPAPPAVLCFKVGVPVKCNLITAPSCQLVLVITFTVVFPVIVNVLPVPRVKLLAATTSVPSSS